ncbi:Methyltransferase domain-containing protein [Lentzea waywayandensis]|uniref:Methyltransferase domain-containing protein n=1 Tax=Lentzea waywayandensis TaxID=84724 RepID=A0A1I6EF73_9PSEU|nr:class I SAM-dependent methyltransferase [Lentzea waywayandensis]SFR16400.1 Methyltransferase domain-containing protein [Lentzea waywayandensis]
MLEQVRRALSAKQLRHKLRVKAIEIVTDAVAPIRAQVDELQRQVDDLGRQVRDEIRHQGDRAVDQARQLEIRTRRDLVFAGEQEAALQSARFVRDHMPHAPQFGHPHETLEHALTLAPEGGLALEFGVYQGTTLKIIATARGGEGVFGFDSFEGLPENWRNGFPAGAFNVDGLPEVPGAELVVGWFDEVLPEFLEKNEGPVTFLHVDCDLYSSTKTVLELVGPRLVEGSVIHFDEYFNFPGWMDHEHKAWTEYVEQTGIEFSYEAFTFDNEQVTMRVTKIPAR